MTPYDTALRVQRREVDALRLSISVEAARLTTIEAERLDIEQSGRQERAVAATLPFTTDAWERRMRADRARLDQEVAHAVANLAMLRAKASAAYGTVRAIEIAAEGYSDQQARAAASAEQASADDLAAAAFLRALRVRKRTA